MKRMFAAIALAAVSLVPMSAVAGDYKFEVTNNTSSKITKILVSEDGREYGFFDIGKGIKPGETAELVWDSSTDGEDCKQYFKAVFADGSESQPQIFDFCEEGVSLEFE